MNINELGAALGAVAAIMGAAAAVWGLRVHGRSLRKSGIVARDAQDAYAQIDALTQHQGALDARGATVLELLRHRALSLQVEALSFTEVTTKSSVYVRLREMTLVATFAAAYLFPMLSVWTGFGQVQVPGWVSWLVAAVWIAILVGSVLGLQLYFSFRSDVIYTARRAFVAHPEQGAPHTYLQATNAAELRALLAEDHQRNHADNEALRIPEHYARCAEWIYRLSAVPAWIAALAPTTPRVLADLSRAAALRLRGTVE